LCPTFGDAIRIRQNLRERMRTATQTDEREHDRDDDASSISHNGFLPERVPDDVFVWQS
jgi:hypothetical protein